LTSALCRLGTSHGRITLIGVCKPIRAIRGNIASSFMGTRPLRLKFTYDFFDKP
jgi:hypothetical protein